MSHDLLAAIHGASTALCVVIGVVFLRYWYTARDRLFALFALAFWCFAVGWIVRVLSSVDEHRVYVFVPRLIGFTLIIVAIVDKNRTR